LYKGKKVAVVVPCFNEAQQIGIVVTTMPDLVDCIVIVDDRSTDHTVTRVRELQASHPRVVLICHERNQGVGGSIATGYEYARDNGFDMAVVMAGDAQMDPRDLPALLDPVVGDIADYAKGNRLITGEAFRKIPRVRYFGNAVLSLLTKIASGYWNVADSQTGYTVINRRALDAMDWRTMYKRYGQPNDILVKLNVAAMRVVDVPIEPVYDVGEKSGIKIRKVVFTIGWLLVRLFFWRLKEKYIIRNFHPLVFFYGFGFLMNAIALLLFARMTLLWIAQGGIPEITLIALLFSLGIGFNAICFAMWFDYQENKPLSVTMVGRKELITAGGPRLLDPHDAERAA
jgi:glycosyltransferase involved in cell wall biosynthesis